MKISTGIITILLIFGLLGVPSGAFAQETSPAKSYTTPHTSTFIFNSFVPLLKGGGGGRGGGRSSSRSGRYSGYYSGYTSAGGSSTSNDSSYNGILNIIAIIMGLGILAPFIWWKIKK